MGLLLCLDFAKIRVHQKIFGALAFKKRKFRFTKKGKNIFIRLVASLYENEMHIENFLLLCTYTEPSRSLNIMQVHHFRNAHDTARITLQTADADAVGQKGVERIGSGHDWRQPDFLSMDNFIYRCPTKRTNYDDFLSCLFFIHAVSAVS